MALLEAEKTQTGSVAKAISSKTAQTVSCFGIPSVAVVAHGLTNSFLVKVSPFSTGNTTLAVPSLTEGILGRCEGSRIGDAISSRVKHVSTIAGSASTIRIPGITKVRNWGADILRVEVKSGRAGTAVMVAVPNETARVNLVLRSDYFTSTIV